LTATFPNVQFVVSTHSPIVLSEVNAASVRILEDFRAPKDGVLPEYIEVLSYWLRKRIGEPL